MEKINLIVSNFFKLKSTDLSSTSETKAFYKSLKFDTEHVEAATVVTKEAFKQGRSEGRIQGFIFGVFATCVTALLTASLSKSSEEEVADETHYHIHMNKDGNVEELKTLEKSA